jgi:homoserine kinase type II
MAVYTQVSAEALGAFLARYDRGELLSAKGIAEGVQNSNYLVETTAGRFILTLYEERTSTDDLPFFLDPYRGHCPIVTAWQSSSSPDDRHA